MTPAKWWGVDKKTAMGMISQLKAVPNALAERRAAWSRQDPCGTVDCEQARSSADDARSVGRHEQLSGADGKQHPRSSRLRPKIALGAPAR